MKEGALCQAERCVWVYPAGKREPTMFSEVRNNKKKLIFQADNSGGSEYRKLEKAKTKARETS